MVRRRAKRVAVVLPEESAPERWLANIRVSGFALLMLALVILAVVVLAPSFRLLIDQRQQVASLQHGVDEQRQHLADLKSQVARWNDPAYIEAQARNRLLFVYPGQYTYLVIADGTSTTTRDGAPISKDIQTTQVDWVHSLVSSILTAGLTDAPAGRIPAPATGGGK